MGGDTKVWLGSSATQWDVAEQQRSDKGMGCSVEPVGKAEIDIQPVRPVGASLFRDGKVPDMIPS